MAQLQSLAMMLKRRWLCCGGRFGTAGGAETSAVELLYQTLRSQRPPASILHNFGRLSAEPLPTGCRDAA